MSRLVCLDANIVVRWLNGPDFPHIASKIGSALDEGSNLVAPGLMLYEATNVVYQSLKIENVALATASALIDALVNLPIAVYHDEYLHDSALTIANRFRIGAPYDAHYIALADHLGAELWTADKRLYNAVQHHLDFVHLIE